MLPRRTILGILAGGAVLGAAMGIAADPDMVPPPEPTWRKVRPDPIFTESQRFVDAGPQDLSPTWHLDRMPTWKRRELERQLAAYVPEFAEFEPFDTFEPLKPERAASQEPHPKPGLEHEPRSVRRSGDTVWPADLPPRSALAASAAAAAVAARVTAAEEAAAQDTLVTVTVGSRTAAAEPRGSEEEALDPAEAGSWPG